MKRPPISLTEKLALKFLSVICISHKNQQYLWILKIRFLVMLQAYFKGELLNVVSAKNTNVPIMNCYNDIVDSDCAHQQTKHWLGIVY